MVGRIPQVSNWGQRYSLEGTARTGVHETRSGDVAFLVERWLEEPSGQPSFHADIAVRVGVPSTRSKHPWPPRGYRRVHGPRTATATTPVATSKEGVEVTTFGRWRRDVTTATIGCAGDHRCPYRGAVAGVTGR